MTKSFHVKFITIIFCCVSTFSRGQNLKSVSIGQGRVTQAETSDGKKHQLDFPTVSFQAIHNGIAVNPNAIKMSVSAVSNFAHSLKFILTFQNTTNGTVSISNVVP